MYIIAGLAIRAENMPTQDTTWDLTRSTGWRTGTASAWIRTNSKENTAWASSTVTKVLLLKPQTYMNLSGECIRDVLGYYKADPNEELIVLFDDISLNPGLIRIRKKGARRPQRHQEYHSPHGDRRIFPGEDWQWWKKPKGWDLAGLRAQYLPEGRQGEGGRSHGSRGGGCADDAGRRDRGGHEPVQPKSYEENEA